jgi:hypothetical protein
MNRLEFWPSFYPQFSTGLISVIPCGIRNYSIPNKNQILQYFKEGEKGRNLPLKCYRPKIIYRLQLHKKPDRPPFFIIPGFN